MACVYALSSSLEPGVVRYIGRAKADDGTRRLGDHIGYARRGLRSHKCSWIRSVETVGGLIVSTVLESGLSWDESCEREIFYIAHYRGAGNALTNLTDGGEGCVGTVQSTETRAKKSASLLGKARKPFTDEHRANMSISHKGVPLSAAHRANIGAAATGKPRGAMSDEARANMSAAHMGKTMPPVSDEARANMSAAQKLRFALERKKRQR